MEQLVYSILRYFFKIPLVNDLNFINGVNGKFSTIVNGFSRYQYLYYRINGVNGTKRTNKFVKS